ncbi:MAG: glycosyltransferase, partial [Phycisphaeraceae bacterium]
MPALVSVIIPTHNRPLQLRACLAALAGSSYPADRFEVVVVDDGGSARLGGIIDALPTGPRVTLIQQEQAGPAAARGRPTARRPPGSP